jgi:hypothetical protein
MTTMSVLRATPPGLALYLGWNLIPFKFPLQHAEGHFFLGLWSLQIYVPEVQARVIFNLPLSIRFVWNATGQYNSKTFTIANRGLEPAMTKNHDRQYDNLNQRIAIGRKLKEIMLI